MNRVARVAQVPQELVVADAPHWRDWLRENHVHLPGVWLVLARKGVDGPTVLTHELALEEALCFGWIDGQTRGGDDGAFRQRFTPRRARSIWSRRNADAAMHLLAEGRMQSPGLAEMERARADGRWEAAYEGQAGIEVPDDLAAALAANVRAGAMFEILTAQNRYAILFRIGGAKRAETRQRRIATFVDMLGRGETVYPQRRALKD